MFDFQEIKNLDARLAGGKSALADLGRRSEVRWVVQLPVALRFKGVDGQFNTHDGVTRSIGNSGMSVAVADPLPEGLTYVYVKFQIGQRTFEISGKVIWQSRSRLDFGVSLDKTDLEWKEFATREIKVFGAAIPDDRRQISRRSSEQIVEKNRRKRGRRRSDLFGELLDGEQTTNKTKMFLRNKSTTYTADMMRQRREWLAKTTKADLFHIAHFSEAPAEFRGKIENPIGVAHVPIGIAGPLKIMGEDAKGTFFIPMATTEGALITSYTFGSNIVTRSGGATVKVMKDELKSDPTFVFKNSKQALAFVSWVESNFNRIKEVAESTSRYLKLLKLTPIINGRRVIVIFHFYTADAMGMNMAYKGTHSACKLIKESVRPEEFWLHSNMTSIKKTTATNFLTGYGKSVMAEVTIPRKLLQILNTSPEAMERYYFRTMLASAQGVLFGTSAHVANAMTAISIACGQDAALVGNTHLAVLGCEVTKAGDLYFSIYLPSVFAATVGGGTAFGTSRECLEILGCYGAGKSKRLAEIITATAMAGEISLMTSVVNGTYVFAHETFGRNRPTH